MSAPVAHVGTASHACVHGTPGERARLRGLVYAVWVMVAVAALGGYLLGSACPVPGLSRTAVGFLFLLLAVAVGLAVHFGRGRLNAFLKGARGEEQVAHELAFLPGAYTVFHGLSSSRTAAASRFADLDHVVVGLTGVFVVETKNWSGAVTLGESGVLCDGVEPSRAPLDQVSRAAQAVRTELAKVCAVPPRVQAVICLAGNTVEGSPLTTHGVIVCNVRDLVTVITGAGDAGVASDDLAASERFLASLLD